MRAVIEVLGRPHVGCVVRNLSEGGALVEPIDTTFLPHAFGLRLGGSNALIQCETVRSMGRTYGVTFKDAGGSAGAAAKRAIRRALFAA